MSNFLPFPKRFGKTDHRVCRLKKWEVIEMYPIYKCLNCGRIWHSGEIMVICPVCRSKPIRIKEGVDIREVVKNIKDGEKIEQNRIQKNNLGTTKGV